MSDDEAVGGSTSEWLSTMLKAIREDVFGLNEIGIDAAAAGFSGTAGQIFTWRKIWITGMGDEAQIHFAGNYVGTTEQILFERAVFDDHPLDDDPLDFATIVAAELVESVALRTFTTHRGSDGQLYVRL